MNSLKIVLPVYFKILNTKIEILKINNIRTLLGLILDDVMDRGSCPVTLHPRHEINYLLNKLRQPHYDMRHCPFRKIQ